MNTDDMANKTEIERIQSEKYKEALTAIKQAPNLYVGSLRPNILHPIETTFEKILEIDKAITYINLAHENAGLKSFFKGRIRNVSTSTSSPITISGNTLTFRIGINDLDFSLHEAKQGSWDSFICYVENCIKECRGLQELRK